jgi:dihydropyrimidinase
MDCIEKRRQAAACSMVDYAFHYSFTKNYREELTFLDDIAGEGIAAFKAYTYYDNTALGTSDFREIMQAIHDRGTLLVHAEEKSIIDAEKAKVPEDKKTDMLNLALTRPRVTERLAVESVLALAEETGTELCIAHTSTGLTADIRRRERLAGNSRFLLETCPHYMHLTQDKLTGPEGALFTMNPPLRTAWDNERLWQAVMEGDISILSTDHCPYHRQYKLGTDYLTVPCGVDGVQTRMLYLFSEGVVKRNLALTEFAKITSTNAAKFYRLYPRKGVIAKGSDADLAVFDPAAQWTWSAGSITGATDYSVLDGLKLTGAVSFVVKGGEIAVKNGEITAAKGSGNFLPAAGA